MASGHPLGECEKALGSMGRQAYVPGTTHEAPIGPPTLWITHKDLRAFESSFHLLRKEHEKASKKAEDYKAEAKLLRDALNDRDKKLSVCKKMFDRVLQERRTMEQQLAANKTYVAKLEYRLSRDGKGKCVVDRTLDLRDRLNAAQEKINQLTSIVEAQTSDLERASREIQTLGKALEVRFECDDDSSRYRGLIREVAERKVEAQSLASELCEKEERLQELLKQLREACEEADEERAAKEKAEANCTHLAQQAMESAEAASRLQGRVEELEAEHNALLKGIEDQSAKCLTLEKVMGSFRGDAEAASHELRSRTQAWGQREAELVQQVEQLTDKLSKRDAVQSLTEEKLVEERKRVKQVTDIILDKDAKLRDVEFEKRALLDEVASLKARVMEFSQRSAKDDPYVAGLRDAKDELETSLRRKLDTEEQMKAEMQALLQDLQRVTGERDQALDGLQRLSSVTARQSSAGDMQRVAAEHAMEIQRIVEKKDLMQKAMLDELSSLKDRLAQETEKRMQLEQTLAELRSKSRTLDRVSARAPPVGASPSMAYDDFHGGPAKDLMGSTSGHKHEGISSPFDIDTFDHEHTHTAPPPPPPPPPHAQYTDTDAFVTARGTLQESARNESRRDSPDPSTSSMHGTHQQQQQRRVPAAPSTTT